MIRCALTNDLDIIQMITYKTINEVYSHYYPLGAVDYFLAHHDKKNITEDILLKCVFIVDVDDIPVGTVTIKGSEICRLFVLPDYQGQGYGRNLLDFAEQRIAQETNRICLHASLPAKAIYLKRGYKEVGFYAIKTDSGDYLCYDIMEKWI